MLYLDIDQPVTGLHFWRIIDDCLDDDNSVISEGQCSTEEEAIKEGNNELKRLELEKEWDDALPDMCTDFDGFVKRIEVDGLQNN